MRWRHWKWHLPEVMLYGAGLVVVLAVFGGSALASPFLSVDQVVGFVITGVFVGTLLFLMELSLWRGLVSIRNGAMDLPFPLRKTDRTVTRTVPLAEIVDIDPSWEGLDIHLDDGTRFFLPRSAFGTGGAQILERLCVPFGKSFISSVSQFVSEGLLPLFVHPTGFHKDAIRLDVPLETFSDRGRRSLRAEDVAWVQPIVTQRAGDAYRFELADGTPCLMARDDLDQLGALTSKVWLGKLRPP